MPGGRPKEAMYYYARHYNVTKKVMQCLNPTKLDAMTKDACNVMVAQAKALGTFPTKRTALSRSRAAKSCRGRMFRYPEIAEAAAAIMERMTGCPCYVVPVSAESRWFYILRCDTEGRSEIA